MGQIDQGTVDIQHRNINSKDHKKKKFDLDFYIKMWHGKLTDFAAKENERTEASPRDDGPGSAASGVASPGAGRGAVGDGVVAVPVSTVSAPSAVAARVAAQVTGGSSTSRAKPIDIAEFEAARRNLNQAVAPTPAVAPALLTSRESERQSERESPRASLSASYVTANGEDVNASAMLYSPGVTLVPAVVGRVESPAAAGGAAVSAGGDVVSSPCSPSSSPPVVMDVKEAATAEQAPAVEAVGAVATPRDAEGFIVDEKATAVAALTHAAAGSS